MLKNLTKFSAPVLLNKIQKDFSLHEYCSHQLLKKYKVPVPNGKVANSPEEAKEVAISLNEPKFVVKAQVLAGGRGKGTFKDGYKGGVKLVDTVEEVQEVASKMIGNVLVTIQSGAEGKPVHKVFVQGCIQAKRELYVAILLDRETKGPVIIASTQGGMSIEDVARDTPELILKLPVDIKKGVDEKKLAVLVDGLKFTTKELKNKCMTVIKNLYTAFCKTDSVLMEINPLIETPDGNVVCADAKINIDDNAFYRQKEIFSLRDEAQEDSRDVEASKHGLNYIGLFGNIANLVNGAGLAMATMDIIKYYGAEPANFLDCGGGSSKDQVEAAFKILKKDKRVKAILVNIFGGITKCDVIASGIIDAVKEVGLDIPLVVRLEGTNAEEGLKLVNESGLQCITAKNLDDAAQKVVNCIKE